MSQYTVTGREIAVIIGHTARAAARVIYPADTYSADANRASCANDIAAQARYQGADFDLLDYVRETRPHVKLSREQAGDLVTLGLAARELAAILAR